VGAMWYSRLYGKSDKEKALDLLLHISNYKASK